MADMKHTTISASPITITPPTQGAHGKILIEAKERVAVDAGEYIRTIEAQEAEIKRLREALEYYADENTFWYAVPDSRYTSPTRVAQAALKAAKGE